ncbi:hypothetical protein FHX42_004423 [Saccharopolyspora lacisalsi]|uniref:Uncharacterized protein n=1 Tax=Halosaccharopolyspora lacisalsi TaxID=1000566 RepID=A0A839E2D3_9PSEU|nr:hypothetical protein [Halosaccharopolyspora lacisalsi]MBA8827039.1 hypothetical protein [Halosaccharopolyspora lacisalsi]
MIIGALAFARLAITTRGQLVTRETVHLPPGECIDVRRAYRNYRLARNSLIIVTILDVLGSVAGVVAPFFMGNNPADAVSFIAPFFGVLA